MTRHLSTRNLDAMPDRDEIHRRMQSLALLDAILCPEWEFRYFSFNDDWEPGEKLGLMRNGEGDDWLLFMNADGVVIKGYHHAAPMSEEKPWPGLFDDVPETFERFLDDPAFLRKQTTFCIWRLDDEGTWKRSGFEMPAGDDPDGSAFLLRFFDGDPATYKAWGDEYFGVPLELDVLTRVYGHEPLVPAIVQALDPDADLQGVREEAREIGYPVG